MRSLRLLAALAIPVLLFSSVGVASAATYNGAIVGLGSARSLSETTGYENLDFSECRVGGEALQNGGNSLSRCTLEYDIDAIPDNATIQTAVLNIYTQANGACGGSACGMVLSGYVGNAATTLSDLTAGSPIGEEAMGTGSYVHFDVKNLVKSVLAGPDFPVAGFNLAHDPQNPTDDWTTVGHPTSNQPPTLVITYGIPTSVTVAVAAAGTGTVAGEASSISCPGTCTDTYLPGAQVKLHANPANGYAFSLWVGSPCAGQGATCTFTMPETVVNVTAAFQSTAPPTAGPSQPAKTRAPGTTAGPAETVAPVTEAPPATGAPSFGATLPPANPAPTIVGLEDPNAQPTADPGVPGVLIFLAVAVLVAAGIGVGVYKYTAARAAKP